ncbi:hypothetical protein ITI46_08495 [Streptomyces oryzae]|uniref:Lipoprotein n=1 Tax=Streptomyces oryzae TaxID=1434886 RepID=A0ABS3X8M7_9ACTN|nr:hypothetical protein [Streptomyces oryzae]MBO8191717.1 hypothetical protein [Streptomyces oryzae]
MRSAPKGLTLTSTPLATLMATILAAVLTGCSGESHPESLPATQKTAYAILPDRATMEGTPYEGSKTSPDGERGGYKSSVCGDYPDACKDRVRAGP